MSFGVHCKSAHTTPDMCVFTDMCVDWNRSERYIHTYSSYVPEREGFIS